MIKVKNLGKTYNGKVKAVSDISFDVNDGEIVGFIGPNGAGKTTTIKMLTGILKPDDGEIQINEFDMKKDPIKAKQIIGYISDNPDTFLKLTGLEYINFLADIYKVTEEERKERIPYFAKQFGMEKDLGERMTSYSHGMRQKLMVIAALVHNPAVWILDEPMVGLDPQAAFHLKQMMREHADKGNSVLFSTHVLEVAEKLCDRIIIVAKGTLQYEGTLDALKKEDGDKDLEKIFLEITGEEMNADQK